MIITAYRADEWKALPDKYKKKVIGIMDAGEVIQPPKCPECGSEMMEQEGYLSCVECGCPRKLRIIG